jgi:glycosyltransferase involved in cell wall biosynthesis
MNKTSPRVTLGVPVYNGESFVAETLDSLLNQTFGDFEIVISDNGSTDRTEQICREYLARDPRIRYYRHKENRGAAWNHNRVFELATGEFFKWNSADDLCVPDFLARCVSALDQDPSAVMACSAVSAIDEHGKPVAADTWNTTVPVEVTAPLPHQRFRRVIQIDHACCHIYSLIRTEVLRKTDLIGNYDDSDRVLLAHLSLYGRCILIPDVLLLNRDHPGRFCRSFVGWRTREGATWFDPGVANRMIFPYWREFNELRRTVVRSPLGLRERLRCYSALHWWARLHKNSLLENLTYYPKRWARRRVDATKALWNGSEQKKKATTSIDSRAEQRSSSSRV